MLPVGSLGAAVSVPTEFCAMPAVRYVQLGSAASASSVRQTPPPETPTHSRQFPGVHVGAITIAVTRLAVVFVAPENASTPGSTALCLGPYEYQWLLPGSPFLAIASKVSFAVCEIVGGISSAGYVRTAEKYASAPSMGPSPGVSA